MRSFSPCKLKATPCKRSTCPWVPWQRSSPPWQPSINNCTQIRKLCSVYCKIWQVLWRGSAKPKWHWRRSSMRMLLPLLPLTPSIPPPPLRFSYPSHPPTMLQHKPKPNHKISPASFPRLFRLPQILPSLPLVVSNLGLKLPVRLGCSMTRMTSKTHLVLGVLKIFSRYPRWRPLRKRAGGWTA